VGLGCWEVESFFQEVLKIEFLKVRQRVRRLYVKGSQSLRFFTPSIPTGAPPHTQPMLVLTFTCLCIKLNKIEMDFKYTKHALVSLEERHIEKNMVEKTISSPDKVFKRKGGREVAQKLYPRSNKDFLLRVIYIRRENFITVITAYWTSKIDKYLEEKNESKI